MNLPLRELKSIYNFKHIHPLPSSLVTGSRNRAMERTPIETDKGRFIVNVLSEEMVARKKNILMMQKTVIEQGVFKIEQFFPSVEGELFPQSRSLNFLTGYLYEHTLPNRPTDFIDSSKGREIGINSAIFLRELSVRTKKIPQSVFSRGPSLIDFVRDFFIKLMKYDFQLSCKVLPYRKLLEEKYFPIEKSMRRIFCHGDFHPLNILWQGQEVSKVIDWEFCGTNPVIYDVANFVGCLGFDEPALLDGELVKLFLEVLVESHFIEGEDKWLNYAILANRFGWLAEWVKHSDIDMIEQELSYMKILQDRCR